MGRNGHNVSDFNIFYPILRVLIFIHLFHKQYFSAIWCKWLTARIIMAEKFLVDGIWNMEDGNEVGL